MGKLWLAIAALALGAMLPVLALSAAAPPVASGTAKGVDPAASAAFDKVTRTLVVGSDIFLGDSVTTGDTGQVQIKFTDGTELVVGPRSSLKIEDYLLRADGSNGKLIVDALAGSFRFVTGRAAKDRYLINTPTGTIGVRGTAFDIFVDLFGRARVLLYHGSTILCTIAEKCVVLTKTCELGEIGDLESLLLGHTDNFTGAARATLRSQFVYAESEYPLLSEFRVAEAYRCLHRLAVEPILVDKAPAKPTCVSKRCR